MCLFGVIKLKFNIKPLFISKNSQILAQNTLNFTLLLQNFYTTWVRGVACQKQRLGPQFEGGWARKHPKNLGPLRISATVEASNFKFGTQIGFGTSLQKTTFRTKISENLG